jgi:hypothetical protein
MKMIISILSVIALSACGTLVSFAPWQDRHDFSAPLLFDGNRGFAYWRCALVPNAFSGGPCQVGFKNHNDKMVRLDEIEDEIDAHVPKLGITGPHQFYVLTFSPTVIMVVPGRSRYSQQCGGENYIHGCFVTSGMKNYEFQYGPRPEVSVGSYLIVPASNSGPVFIPNGSQVFNLTLPDSTLRLDDDGAHWKVLRHRK